jgi:hypothetical protein
MKFRAPLSFLHSAALVILPVNGRFFHKHKKLTRRFYSGKAVNKRQSGDVRSSDQLGVYLWTYENDAAKTATFRKALHTFYRDLGLRAVFNPTSSQSAPWPSSRASSPRATARNSV